MVNRFKNFGHILLNYFYDFFVFIKYSGVFSNNSEEKILGKIIYNYHSIEKGLINEPIRYRFGKLKIKKLLHLLEIWIERNYNNNNSQFISACSVLVKYYYFHKNENQKVDDIIPDDKIVLLQKYANENTGGILKLNSNDYFKNSLSSFDEFSNSRHSVRHFNGKKIDISIIEKAIALARNAPSVCNRQSVEVILVNNKDVAQSILTIQSGMNATAENVNQILIITSEIGSFISPVERNQMFIDGGIFLQNLLYALHFNRIAACALNWSKPFFYEYKVRKYLKISQRKRIIAIVAIGYPIENFKVPFSCRKEVNEIFHVIHS